MWDDDDFYDDHGREYHVEVRRVPLFGGFGPDISDGIIDVTPGRSKGLSFSDTEIRHLTIATIVLTIAFTLLFTDGISGLAGRSGALVFLVPIAFLAVLTGFLCREIGHKYVAQRYGYWAEFRYSKQGLILALIISLLGFVVAAPGAVIIGGGHIDRERNGKISIAGPCVNIFWLILALPLVIMFKGSLIGYTAFIVGIVNAFLAGFNMLPFHPFDGSKVYRWNKGIYIGLFATIIVLGISIYRQYLTV